MLWQPIYLANSRKQIHASGSWDSATIQIDSADIELYDYDADPRETKNLAAEKPEIVTRMRAILAGRFPEAKPQWRGKATAPKQDRAAMFAAKDKDNDGKLTRGEFLANQSDPGEAPARFLQFDADKDGALSREEFILKAAMD